VNSVTPCFKKSFLNFTLFRRTGLQFSACLKNLRSLLVVNSVQKSKKIPRELKNHADKSVWFFNPRGSLFGSGLGLRQADLSGL